MDKQRLTLPKGAVPVRRFVLAALLCLAAGVLFPLVYWMYSDPSRVPIGAQDPPKVFLVAYVAVGIPVVLFTVWVFSHSALRGMGAVPFAVLKREQRGVSIVPRSVLGIPGRAFDLDSEAPLDFRVRIFREQAKGTTKPKLIAVMLIELSQRGRRVASARTAATPAASLVDWSNWAHDQCQGFTEVAVVVEDTTANGSFVEGPK